MEFVEVLDTSKSNSGDISTKIIKMAKESIGLYLTDYMNAVIYNCSFPDEFKKADVSAMLKNGDPSCKGNCRPISILAALSKIYERNKGAQMNSHFNGILSPLKSASGKDTVPSMPYSVQPKLGKGTLMPMAFPVLP